MVSAPILDDTTLSIGTAEWLFQAKDYLTAEGRTFDLARDGRFLMVKPLPLERSAQARINIVLDWHTELLDRVPVR